MFYQEALPKFWFVSCVSSLLAIAGGHLQTLAATFEKPKSANSLWNRCLFMWGACFCMGAYKHDVIVEIKIIFMGACFVWVRRST